MHKKVIECNTEVTIAIYGKHSQAPNWKTKWLTFNFVFSNQNDVEQMKENANIRNI
mgnify:FL=1